MMALVWGAFFGGLFFLRWRWRDGLVLGAAVVSHWVLDWITHRPDLPLTLDAQSHYGLGLWNSIPATILVELTLFAAGLWFYAREATFTPRLRALVAFLVLIYFANIAGPPPPNEQALTAVSFAQWLIPLWGWWGEPKSGRKQS